MPGTWTFSSITSVYDQFARRGFSSLFCVDKSTEESARSFDSDFDFAESVKGVVLTQATSSFVTVYPGKTPETALNRCQLNVKNSIRKQGRRNNGVNGF